MNHHTILGIDPGTKEMGLAVLRGSKLITFGVRTLRNGTRPHDVIGQARRIVLAAIAAHAPQVVAIEEPLMLPTKRAALMSVIVQELRARTEELNLGVVELSPSTIRERVAGNPRATKIEVANVLVGSGFDQLRGLIPKRPVRAALGMRPRDKYWLHMFDALALAVAAQAAEIGHDAGLDADTSESFARPSSIARSTNSARTVASDSA
jgi:Holliday junction resolvasome RuvABC endonuclease subunit